MAMLNNQRVLEIYEVLEGSPKTSGSDTHPDRPSRHTSLPSGADYERQNLSAIWLLEVGCLEMTSRLPWLGLMMEFCLGI